MAFTKFRLDFENDPPDINLDLFRQSLPTEFKVDKEDETIYVSIPSSEPEDGKCQFLIDREIDRFFYLTCVKVKALIVTKRAYGRVDIKYRIHGGLDKNIKPQKWTYELPLQLRLWSLAEDTKEVLLKIILLFQIIEIAYPERHNYPEYMNASLPPNPLSECKFLRNMAAHSGDVSHVQLERYCEYLKVPPLMHDPTDPAYLKLFKSKIWLLKNEAKKAIEKSL